MVAVQDPNELQFEHCISWQEVKAELRKRGLDIHINARFPVTEIELISLTQKIVELNLDLVAARFLGVYVNEDWAIDRHHTPEDRVTDLQHPYALLPRELVQKLIMLAGKALPSPFDNGENRMYWEARKYLKKDS